MAMKRHILCSMMLIIFIAVIVVMNSSLRYWIVGIPIFSLPYQLRDTPIEYYLTNKKTVSLSDQASEKVEFWLQKNRSGWSSTLAWMSYENVLVIGNVVLNFHFDRLEVFASFPIKADGTLTQLYHPLSPQDRDMLIEALKINSKSNDR